MNILLNQLQTYPFEKLRQLLSTVNPKADLAPISLGLGEPKHPTPLFIQEALTQNLKGLSNYPATAGSLELRQAIAQWLAQRYHLPALDAATQILPTNGSREALFSLAQALITPDSGAIVLCPNPFYQIYEGAAYMAGASPYFVNADAQRNFVPDYEKVPAEIWQHTKLVYVCSPGNPTGAVLPLDTWKLLFELSDQYGFVLVSDECYSEIYCNESPPLGALEVAHKLGRADYSRLVVVSSLSKRSNVPGMRSGFVAGDAAILKPYLLYRTYHGSAMSPCVQAASTAAWKEETHVAENRRQYQEKFKRIIPILQPVLAFSVPDAAFYIWANVRQHSGLSDTDYAKRLYADYHVTVLPGSYMARTVHGFNPGNDYIRLALVAELEECLEAAQRIAEFSARL